ncbi:MAG: glycosyltransferase family 9 protein [Candidatus Marinimicrobia bacterium]|nr:glycosyltransferase family 9 protein [Candidatus Neomarinimicrobiota bacterium]MBT3618218.1 glycosyltransferase family 9 protein [Candidatus Neomarinimicrobiota bacterium]MBT3829544.1 glycosyltransferase family 9 protein [Candidatus Neomarinimicrobiota bacterium]MBT3997427.1 glycosyltransferase family 9 protein [Candidatus Neomarinimicrobiota bacterium]MBT4281617.1 glycosyltransferase family 9 protein [Candidatus Neomarinimicrobiota bacterium]
MNIAVYAPNWLGDAVMALPFVSQCAQFHGQKVSVVCKSWVAPVFENHPNVKEIIQYEAEDLSGIQKTVSVGNQLKQHQFSHFYLLSDSFRCAFIAWKSGAEEISGFHSTGRSLFLTKVINTSTKPIHRSKKYIDLIQSNKDDQAASINQLSGISLTEEEINFGKNILKTMGILNPIAIFPFSIAKSRSLPDALTVDILNTINRPAVIFGSESDKPNADILVEKSQNNVFSLCGKFSLRKTIAIISQCVGAIATDSGLGHISANLGIPTVSIFGAGDQTQTRPIGPKAMVINKQVHCSPCKKNSCINQDEPLLCIDLITAQEVNKALLNISI